MHIEAMTLRTHSLVLLAALIALFPLTANAAPTDEMFEKLLSAESDEDASRFEADIWASWFDSDSGTVTVLMDRALVAFQAEDFETTRELLDRVILIAPNYPEAWNRRAALFVKNEDYEQAIRDLNEVIKIEPRHFGAWTVLGQVLESLGSRKEALDAYREALKIHPRMEVARRAVGRLGTTQSRSL